MFQSNAIQDDSFQDGGPSQYAQPIGITQGETVTLVKSVGKIVTFTGAQVVSLARSVGKIIKTLLSAQVTTLKNSSKYIATITSAQTVTLSRSVSKIISLLGVAGDPYFNNVVLLMGFNGTAGSTVFMDEGPNAHGTGTDVGAPVVTASSEYGSGALSLDGDSFVSFPSSTDWQLSTQNSDQFTIEVSILSAGGIGNNVLLGSDGTAGNRGWSILYGGASMGISAYYDGTHAWSVNPTAAYSFTTGQWYRLAVDKDATGKVRVYVEGVMIASGTPANSALLNTTAVMSVGSTPPIQAFGWPGSFDELRITKGVARYASDSGYTPATAAFPRNASTLSLVVTLVTAITHSKVISFAQAQVVTLLKSVGKLISIAIKGFGPVAVANTNSPTQINTSPGQISVRSVLPTVAAASYGSVKVTFEASSSGGAQTVDHCSIGVWNGTGGAAGCTATPIELTFGGTSGFTLPNVVNATITSDWVTLAFGATDRLVVITDYNAATASLSQNSTAGGAAGFETFLAGAASYNQTNPGGYASANFLTAVSEVDTGTQNGSLYVSLSRSIGKIITSMLSGQVTTLKRANTFISTISSGQSVSLTRSVGHFIILSGGQIVTLARSVGKQITSASAQVVLLTKSVGKNIALMLSGQVTTLKRVNTFISTITSGQSISLTKLVGHFISFTSPQAVSLTRTVGKYISYSLSQVVTLSRLIGKNISVAWNQLVTLGTVYIPGSTSHPLTILISTPQVVTVRRAVSHAISWTMGQVVSLYKTANKPLSLAQGQLVTLVQLVAHRVVQSITQSQAVVLVKSVGKNISAGSGQVVTLTKNVLKILRVSLGQSITTIRLKAFGLFINLNQGQIVSVLRGVAKAISARSAQAITVAKRVSKTLPISQGQIVMLTKTFPKTIRVTIVDPLIVLLSVGKNIQMIQSGQKVTLGHSIAKTILLGMQQSISVVKAMGHGISSGLGQSVMLTRSVGKRIQSSLQQLVTMTETRTRIASIAFTNSQLVTLSKRVGKLITIGSGQFVTLFIVPFTRIHASLVCAAIDLYAAVKALFVSKPAVDGAPEILPAVEGAPSVAPVVDATLDIEPKVLGKPDAEPAVVGTPDMRKC